MISFIVYFMVTINGENNRVVANFIDKSSFIGMCLDQYSDHTTVEYHIKEVLKRKFKIKSTDAVQISIEKQDVKNEQEPVDVQFWMKGDDQYAKVKYTEEKKEKEKEKDTRFKVKKTHTFKHTNPSTTIKEIFA
jgi:hypothetical protein